MTLPNRPEWSGSARVSRGFHRGLAFVEYQYVGENYSDPSENIVLDARNVFNIGLRYDISPSSRLTAGINDIFDDADEWRMRPEGGLNGPTRMLWYPVEGRSYYMTLDIEL
jgi:outer membrane receptor for ferrienterochelin and colicin